MIMFCKEWNFRFTTVPLYLGLITNEGDIQFFQLIILICDFSVKVVCGFGNLSLAKLNWANIG